MHWLDANNSGVTQTNTIGPTGSLIPVIPATPIPPVASPPILTPSGGGFGFCLSGYTSCCWGLFSCLQFLPQIRLALTQYLRIHPADNDVPLGISSHHMVRSADGRIRTAEEFRVGIAQTGMYHWQPTGLAVNYPTCLEGAGFSNLVNNVELKCLGRNHRVTHGLERVRTDRENPRAGITASVPEQEEGLCTFRAR